MICLTNRSVKAPSMLNKTNRFWSHICCQPDVFSHVKYGRFHKEHDESHSACLSLLKRVQVLNCTACSPHLSYSEENIMNLKGGLETVEQLKESCSRKGNFNSQKLPECCQQMSWCNTVVNMFFFPWTNFSKNTSPFHLCYFQINTDFRWF